MHFSSSTSANLSKKVSIEPLPELQVFLNDRYVGDLGFLGERSTSEKDRDAPTSDQIKPPDDHIEKRNLIQIDSLSLELRDSAEERIEKLKDLIRLKVIEILRARTTPE